MDNSELRQGYPAGQTRGTVTQRPNRRPVRFSQHTRVLYSVHFAEEGRIVVKKLIACALTAVAPLAGADVLLLDGIEMAQAAADQRPVRGMRMESVESNFGPPTVQQLAVGVPPITRWEYPGFVVYFEYQYVIHAVATP